MAFVRDELRIASLLNFLIGVWLILAPYGAHFDHLPASTWNSIGAGLVLMIVAVAEMIRPRRMVGLNWINLALGLWLIASPFLLNLRDSAEAILVHVAMGLFVVAIAAGSILGVHFTAEAERGRKR